jgi:hypothetical protein
MQKTIGGLKDCLVVNQYSGKSCLSGGDQNKPKKTQRRSEDCLFYFTDKHRKHRLKQLILNNKT